MYAPTTENRVQSVGKTFIKASAPKKNIKGLVKGTIKYQDQWWNKLSWGSNQQRIFELCALGTRSQWLTTTDATVDNRDIDSYQSWFTLNPLQGVAAGNIVPANSNPNADRMAFTTGTVFIDLMNTSSLPCFTKFHVFYAKQDNEEGPLFDYALGLSTNYMYTNNYAFPSTAGSRSSQSGNINAAWVSRNNTTTVNYCTVPPYHNIINQPNLKSQWKRLASKSITLAAADSHRVTIGLDVNQFALKERISDNVSTYPVGSIVVVIECQGALALDTTDTTGTLGLSAGELSYAITRRVNLAPMKNPNKRFRTEFYANPEMSGGASVPAQKIISQGAFSNIVGSVLA